MEFSFSKKANSFQLNIFNILEDKRQVMLAAGRKIYNFSVGTPDFPPAKHVMESVMKAAGDSENYKYSLGDTSDMINAVSDWYKRRYDVELSADEIVSVAGTQEGMAHIALTVCDENDIVLVPNPGYPIFEIGPYLNGAKVEYYDLLEENNYLPDFEKIDPEIAKRAKMIIISYPLNPVCVCAPKKMYEDLIAFAKKYNILVVNDNAYSEIIYDGREGYSFLSLEGAKEVGVEFNSLSKSYNLTGLRISFLLGNKEVIKKFKTIRSQYDYGMSFIVQRAAVAALEGPQDVVLSNRLEYQKRRDTLCEGLRAIGWDVKDSEGTMFVWLPLVKGYTDSEKFCMDLLENTGVLCTPGSAFGSLGKDHVRIALVLPCEVITEAIGEIKKWFDTF